MKFNKNKIIINILIFLSILLILSIFSTVNAVPTKDIGTFTVDTEKTLEINNENAPKFVQQPVKYSISSRYGETTGFETKKNIIKTKAGNKKYTFRTEYFLPMSWKNSNGWEYWYNCQSMLIQGKYMYVVSSSGYNLNRGFIVRYDMNILKKYKLNSGKGLVELRKLGAALRDKENLTSRQKNILKGVKKGPIFNIGHGQTLSYNPKTKSLWMLRDVHPSSTKIKLMRISMKTLKPISIIKFSLNYNGKKMTSPRTLTFDREGNFYFTRNRDTKSILIFKNRIINNKVESTLLANISNRPGTITQVIGINHVTKRFYIVSDGAFYTLALKKLNKGTLTQQDLHYTVLATKRESEGIAFDKQGRTYLLLIRGTEVMKANPIYH
ncbi:MAG: hypothetical protein FWE58_05910 [Methanobrevibacter sp.]|nr:hypothetical protein [Methanobrevibacter sp.]